MCKRKIIHVKNVIKKTQMSLFTLADQKFEAAHKQLPEHAGK